MKNSIKLRNNKENFREYMACKLCPRECGVNRNAGQKGFCKVSSELMVARAALHYWEEPCISGENGSGAVFFSGCNMHCVYCQNEEISWGEKGKDISPERLAEIFLELEEKGANNINLVTPTHFIPTIIAAVESAKINGLGLPIIYNSSGYEKVDTLKRLEGIVDVYLPDFKYMSKERSEKYSHSKNYAEITKLAIDEMVRQKPKVKIGYNKMIESGVIVRHLLLPGGLKDSKRILKYLYTKYNDDIFISIMSQYTPLSHVEKYQEICRKVTPREYDQLVKFAIDIGIKNGFIQEGEVAEDSFIPHFDSTGV